MAIFFSVLAAVVVALAIYVMISYNRLVALKHNVKTAWSNIDVLLLQRHDELPKLVATCKQHMSYEQETLERVIKARSQVSEARESSNLGALGSAEGMLSASLGRLFAVAEDYPELKASQSFQQLQSRISALEEAIADRREFYNDSVNFNNITVDAFPTNIIADKFNFFRSKPFKVEQQKREDVDMVALFE